MASVDRMLPSKLQREAVPKTPGYLHPYRPWALDTLEGDDGCFNGVKWKKSHMYAPGKPDPVLYTRCRHFFGPSYPKHVQTIVCYVAVCYSDVRRVLIERLDP
jgi:hypothetical protein